MMNFTKYEEYKDSGLEWLGRIPEGWELKRVKDVTQTQSGTTPQSDDKTYYENGDTFWIRTTDLNNNELYSAEYKINKKAFEDYSLPYLKTDSVLLAMYGGMGTIGKNAVLKTEATINQSVCAILPNTKQFNSKFLLYLGLTQRSKKLDN